ncbi:unnamed protein product [Protopolystoma xenopodis]|uniref:Secreted protein n=1 Tax=Protopolystoma xenopodis TaxID=117903 RepID=A0A448WYY3_9PLAT|nr:unnamed protein product [Protopolystoma xenopodis]
MGVHAAHLLAVASFVFCLHHARRYLDQSDLCVSDYNAFGQRHSFIDCLDGCCASLIGWEAPPPPPPPPHPPPPPSLPPLLHLNRLLHRHHLLSFSSSPCSLSVVLPPPLILTLGRACSLSRVSSYS